MSQSDKGIFVVIDEAHHTVASQYRNILKPCSQIRETKI